MKKLAGAHLIKGAIKKKGGAVFSKNNKKGINKKNFNLKKGRFRMSSAKRTVEAELGPMSSQCGRRIIITGVSGDISKNPLDTCVKIEGNPGFTPRILACKNPHTVLSELTALGIV